VIGMGRMIRARQAAKYAVSARPHGAAATIMIEGQGRPHVGALAAASADGGGRGIRPGSSAPTTHGCSAIRAGVARPVGLAHLVAATRGGCVGRWYARSRSISRRCWPARRRRGRPGGGRSDSHRRRLARGRARDVRHSFPPLKERLDRLECPAPARSAALWQGGGHARAAVLPLREAQSFPLRPAAPSR